MLFNIFRLDKTSTLHIKTCKAKVIATFWGLNAIIRILTITIYLYNQEFKMLRFDRVMDFSLRRDSPPHIRQEFQSSSILSALNFWLIYIFYVWPLHTCVNKGCWEICQHSLHILFQVVALFHYSRFSRLNLFLSSIFFLYQI